MTAKEKEDAINELTAYIHCLKCDRSGKVCDDNCPTQYEAGNCGEIIKNLEFLLEEVKKMPTLFKSAYNLLAYYKPLEPCEDAISKAEVIKLIDKHTNDDGTLDDDITCILEELPPVQPKAKMGKWIVDQDAFSEINGYILKCHCSECNHKKEFYDHKSITTPTLKNVSFIYNYCPICGAKMEREVQDNG